MVFPLSAAAVERLFSRLKLVKTRLRNRLEIEQLNKLLMIAKESPSKLTDEDLEMLVNILHAQNPTMRMT